MNIYIEQSTPNASSCYEVNFRTNGLKINRPVYPNKITFEFDSLMLATLEIDLSLEPITQLR